MNIEIENLPKVISLAISDSIQRHLANYNSPISDLINSAIKNQSQKLVDIFSQAIVECVENKDFVTEIKAHARSQLAKHLVQRFGGEVEKSVNALKSDPTTRARIVLAIDEIIASKLG